MVAQGHQRETPQVTAEANHMTDPDEVREVNLMSADVEECRRFVTYVQRHRVERIWVARNVANRIFGVPLDRWRTREGL